MATNFPSSLDVFTNPTSTSSMSGALSHAGQHSDLNDAVEALQAKVGADSSAVTSSLDYKVAQLEAGATGGKILQVVSATYSTAESTTSTSPVATSLTASITPSSASNKVLVITNVHTSISDAAVISVLVHQRIYRGATGIGNWGHIGYQDYAGSTGRLFCANNTLMVLDAPATTSSTTYTLYHWASGSGTATAFFQDKPGSMLLMEVSA